jgi:hypothetical protein
MNEDLLELKRNIIQYHSNADNFADDEKPSDGGGAADSTDEEQPGYDGSDANFVADRFEEDQDFQYDLFDNVVVDQYVEDQDGQDDLVANLVADKKLKDQPVHQAPVLHIVDEQQFDDQPVYQAPVANLVAEQKLKDQPVQQATVIHIMDEQQFDDQPVYQTPVANLVAEQKLNDQPVQQAPVANIVAEQKLEDLPAQQAPVANIVSDKKFDDHTIQQTPVANIVAEQKLEDQPVQQDLVANIMAKQRGGEPLIDQVNIAQPEAIAEEPALIFRFEDEINEQPNHAAIDTDISAQNRVGTVPNLPEQTPSSGELMGTGLHLLWCGGSGFVMRLFSGGKNILSAIWRGIRNLFAFMITSRRPAMEMLIAIPVALFIGYQFKGFNNNHGEVNIPLNPTYSQIQLVQPVVAADTYVKSQKKIALVPQESQAGVDFVRNELTQKVAAWRDNLLKKVAVLQKRSDVKEAKHQENISKNAELLVVVKPPKDPLDMYQARLTDNMPITRYVKKAKNTKPEYNRSVPVALPVQTVAAPPVHKVVAPPVHKVAAPPVQVKPVQVALKIPTEIVAERPSRIVIPQPLKAAIKKTVNSAMVKPTPLKKQLVSKVGVPTPQSKILTQKQVKRSIATPAPVKKAKNNFIKKRKIVKNSSQNQMQAKATSPKGFVLFLGSYRQSKAEYLQTITDNLLQEPFNLIKQTVQINAASYTRLYAGPFADRNAAKMAKKALFASKKIDASITYLQPGVTKYSRIDGSGKKVNSVNNSTRNRTAKPQFKEKYVIRVGSYQNVGVDSSGNLLRKIVSLGGVGFQKGIKVKGKTFWRVYSGPFANLKQANQAKDALEEELSIPNILVMSKNGANRWVRISEANRS